MAKKVIIVIKLVIKLKDFHKRHFRGKMPPECPGKSRRLLRQ